MDFEIQPICAPVQRRLETCLLTDEVAFTALQVLNLQVCEVQARNLPASCAGAVQ